MGKTQIRLQVAGAAVLAVVVFGSIAAANAQPPFMGPGGHGLWRAEKIAAKLDLSDAQRDQFAELEQASRERLRPFVRQMVEGREQIHELMQMDTFNETAVRQVAQANSAALIEMMVEHARQRHQMRQLLTPEQRQKMQAMKSRHGRHGGH